MFLGLCLIGAICVGWAIASATRPATESSRRRDLDRRARVVRRHPDRVHLLDVENLLLAASVPTPTVQRAMRRAESRRLRPRTMWRWSDTYGPDKLVLVIDAALAEDTLMGHLDGGTTPDWGALGVFARLADDEPLADMPGDEPGDLEDWTTALAPEELSRFDTLPPISGPGLHPFAPAPVREAPDGDGWPYVA